MEEGKRAGQSGRSGGGVEVETQHSSHRSHLIICSFLP